MVNRVVCVCLLGFASGVGMSSANDVSGAGLNYLLSIILALALTLMLMLILIPPTLLLFLYSSFSRPSTCTRRC